uniref:Dachshund n=1 Tax=Anopheles minimus TaxID=112268 RepID=A0A182W9N5_9DIPT
MIDLPRLDKSPLLANGYNAPPTHLNHIPFMQMNPHPSAGGHPLMSPGVNPHGIQRPDGSIIKGQNIPGMEAIARSHHTGIWENCRAAYEDIVKHLERLREERGDDRTPNVDHKPRDLSSQGSGPPLTDSPNGQSPALNLSKSGIGDHHGVGASGGGAAGGGGGGGGNSSRPQSERSNPISPEPSVHEEDENMSEANISDTEEPNDKDEGSSTHRSHGLKKYLSPCVLRLSTDISDCERDMHSPVPAVLPIPAEIEAHRQQALNYSSLAASVAVGAVPTGPDPNISSTETLLRNIQGLLKVAADNARQQERQTSYEKAELKMDVIREREVKDSFERQLADEKRLRALYQKRFKKERRLRIQIQERLDGERKRRVQLEDIIKASGAPAEALRIIAALYQKRFKKERRLRIQIQERLDGERKRRVQLEDIIKASGAPAEALRIIAENISSEQQQREKESRDPEKERDKERDRDRDRRDQRDKGQEREREHHLQQSASSAGSASDRNRSDRSIAIDESLRADRHRVESERERRASSSERYSKEESPAPNHSSSSRPSQEVSPAGQAPLSEGGKSWNYTGLDIMATGAFWQNYSESLAQELELERKARQQATEGEVKGPLQDRSNYYKNSVLYTSAT